MKKLILIMLFSFFVSIVLSQENKNKTTVYFEEGVFKNSLVINTALSKKWSFENKLQISYTDYFNQIEIPVTIKFDVTDKLSFFLGSNINYMMITDVYNTEPKNNISIMAQAGARYDFAKEFFGEIKYEYNIINTKSNYNIIPKGGELRFGGGIKF